MEWITGRNPSIEVLRARRRQVFRLWLAKGVEQTPRLRELLALAEARKVRVEPVARQMLERINESHQGVALEVSSYPYAALQDIEAEATRRGEPSFILALDALQNPQNLGVLLRSADAFGIHGVLMPLARAAGITPAVVQASAGASEHLLVAAVNLAQALTHLKEDGAWVIGLDGGERSQPLEQVRLDGALVLVVGNEGEGMRALIRKSCDHLVRLPMRGQVESLNAAVAGSIALYLVRQSREVTRGK
ncbi:MAG: 23S rRNA (guanosine(2251)-2'-O)-methyltransferase RlmB [Anaerolineae bacterium]|nr:23S rRNA (guanosine(2251)-2'-O)-methyltransferase RlmB [Anaerolineae bacterium]